MITKAEIISSASSAVFGKPLVTNVYRSVIVEAIVANALADWTWCSADYAACDFERNGTRLEVKQSAMRQTWSSERMSMPSWDIAPRTGFWEGGTTWIAKPGRNADIYVLALHAVVDDNADHRDPLQWQFFVASADLLPASKRIGLSTVRKISGSASITELREVVEEALSRRLDRRSNVAR